MEHFPSQRGRPRFTDDAFWAPLRLRGLGSNSPSRFAEGLHGPKIRL